MPVYREGVASVGLFFIILFAFGIFFFVLVMLCRLFKNLCGADYTDIVWSTTTRFVPTVALLIFLGCFFGSSIIASYGSTYI